MIPSMIWGPEEATESNVPEEVELGKQVEEVENEKYAISQPWKLSFSNIENLA